MGAVETEKLTDDVKAKVEAIDNKPIVAGYSAAFIAVLILTGKIVNLPVLDLLLPKTTELMGVIVSIVGLIATLCPSLPPLRRISMLLRRRCLPSNCPAPLRRRRSRHPTMQRRL